MGKVQIRQFRRGQGREPIGPWILIVLPYAFPSAKRNGKTREAMGSGSIQIAFSIRALSTYCNATRETHEAN